ncbi:hypothetical protein [Microcoleus sp. PH2017_05_CCC_O_A]|uniref:hypothetical protein n=1 Tax=Microcoleus sp. PH2017_05_CCC_O_A TaxID=2798816 RepID=UPI001E039435|nr:hypothetical protein [Microcoleus sp. PH2017_05_CCC_O_A]MCC3436797.1 hypothetical protein [Microcoleus sp. PH2017_05_CCC_O_A]TAG44244.1 MAG: hypothetical protein EAZ33_10770 [Oscillatoriales cyanobacterium]
MKTNDLGSNSKIAEATHKLEIKLIAGGLILGLLVAVPLVYAPEVQAASGATSNPLELVLQQFSQQVESLRSYVEKTLMVKLQDMSKNLGNDLQSAVSQAMGDLGLPDPAKSRDAVEKSVGAKDLQVNKATELANEIDRESARATAAGTLSEAGQKQQVEQAAATQDSVKKVQQFSEQAQGDVVTQDVMKRLASQNSEIANTLGSVRADALKAEQSRAQSNVLLSNISKAQDSQIQLQKTEQAAQGLGNLETASQAKLF